MPRRIVGISLETLEVVADFPSQAEAKRAGLNSGMIYACLHRYRDSYEGVCWMYMDEALNPEVLIKRIKRVLESATDQS